MRGRIIIAATLALLTGATAACSQTSLASSDVSAVATTTNISAPETIVDAFAAALRAGDARAVETLMAPNVIIAESGSVERSFAEYAAEHLPADIAFSAAVQSTTQQRDVIATGDAATVISRGEVRGQFEGRAIHSQTMETMELRRTNGVWRIVHIHWSSSPIRSD